MSRQQEVMQWLNECPQLAELWSISAKECDGANIIFPIGTSQRRTIRDSIDITGCYCAEITPTASVYEEYQINCYKDVVNNDNPFNALKLEEAENVIEWVTAQDEAMHFPQLTDKTVVEVDCVPHIPQIRGIDPDTGTVCYYITLRIRYVNTAKGRSVELC